MSYHLPYYDVPPTYTTPVYPTQTHLGQVHPASQPPIPEEWIVPREPLRNPRHISRRHRHEPEAFEAYEYPAPQSKPKDHSRIHGQHCTRLKESTHSERAMGYRDQEWEATNILDEYRKEPTAPIRSQRVQPKDRSSKPGDAQKIGGPESAGADKQAEGISANPAGTEREHTTKQSTTTRHRKPDNKHHPEKPGEQGEKRTSTNTPSRERAHTTSHPSSANCWIQPKKSQSGPKVTIKEHEGSSLKINYDPDREKIRISTPAKKGTSHRSKEKPKEKPKKSPGASRGTKLTKETVPDYYSMTGSCINAASETISKDIKRKQLAVHPDKRVTSEMSEQEIAKINGEAALVNEAAEVLKDAQRKAKYDQKWQYVYGRTACR